MAAESTQPGRLGAFSGFDFEIRRRAAQQVELATPAMHAFTLPIVHRDVDVTCATLGPSAVS